MNAKFSLLALFFVAILTGCNSTLINQKPGSNGPVGIPWTETRAYDVYVFVGGESTYTLNAATSPSYVATQTPKQIYVGTYDLLDFVNDKPIDPARQKWEINYRAMLFSDGGLELALDDNGAVKRAKITGKPGTASAVNAATTIVKRKDDLETEELADLKRKIEMIEQQKKLEGLLKPATTTGSN